MSVAYKTVQLVDAKRVVEAAVKKAEELKRPVSIAVVGADGYLLAFERMEGAPLASVDLAMKKAWTAKAFNLATKDLAKLAQPGGEFYGVESDARVVLMMGGVPLLQDNLAIGAMGVAGAKSTAQDVEIAEAGATAF
ncbi:heme-binding protein [Granulicella cerasi]|uniref:Heme-binding protein n=1 Tax=Granulicella cerasi TaxID=741063 RepID=A0ABW1ZCY8_9BACT|nr:heme-binding protein [Granulicella cerasi]